MEKRYQVFVSSTFEDLQEERKEVMQALLELDCIPCGMELFPAADEDQWSLIKRVIDDCDYYILILAGRYGSMNEEGIGYTEMEYRYALETHKPIIAFVHANIEELPAKKVEKTPEGKEKLEEFRKLVEKKVRKTWTTPADLGSVVSRGMINLIKRHPAEGWVKAGNVSNEELSKELLELRRENEELKAKIVKNRMERPDGTENLSQGEDLIQISLPYKGRNSRSEMKCVEVEIETTWNELFSVIAPHLLTEDTEKNLKEYLYDYFISKEIERIQKDAESRGLHSLHETELDENEFQKIKVQFKALGFIEMSNKQRSVKDTENYWTLTEYGDLIMTQLIAIRRDSSLYISPGN